MVAEALALFGWEESALSYSYRPAIVFAGEAKFLALPLAGEADLRTMSYEQKMGAAFMRANGLLPCHCSGSSVRI